MATKTKKRAQSATKGSRTNSRVGKVVESAVDAVEELGEAATAFKESWDHVQKARRKASPATRAATRAGKRAVKAAKKAIPKRLK